MESVSKFFQAGMWYETRNSKKNRAHVTVLAVVVVAWNGAAWVEHIPFSPKQDVHDAIAQCNIILLQFDIPLTQTAVQIGQYLVKRRLKNHFI